MNFYPRSNKGEIDLRKELHELLFGSPTEVAKGQYVVFRRMRRKSGVVYPSGEDDLVWSPARDPYTFQGSKDYINPWSEGEKYLFDDQMIKKYSSYPTKFEGTQTIVPIDPGNIPAGIVYHYVESWVMPSIWDKLIEVVVNEEGIPISPIKMLKSYSIKSAEMFRSDKGRIEYFRIS